MRHFWMEQIKMAVDLDGLNAITEQMAEDESLTNTEYVELYAVALAKAQTWAGR